MKPAPIYARPIVLECLQRAPLRHLDAAEASKMHVTASSLIDKALTWGSARARVESYKLEARREAGDNPTLVSLCVRCGDELVIQEQAVLGETGRNAA